MICGRGFSLIEMLVVLFVIVLMTSLVTLNVSSGAGDRLVQERLETLVAVAAYALDEAQFSGSDFGVLFANSVNERGEPTLTAHWRQRLNQGWRGPQDSAEVFESLEFPGNVRLQIRLDDVELLPAAMDAVDPLAGAIPQWLMLSSGETQAGELLIRNRDDDVLLWRLSWDALGRFRQFRGDNDETVDEYAVAR
ncbi:type II secretion system protein [Congregibacter variabilis]|uniref:Type II secretion system protein n=1 Tax=Congregibacter variabilis TaxID=3081200 RepID=A0ABZ0I5W3_9GAMM|nr:type II secretion system protein [Congregibacter sp. IMCC43200]